MISEIGKIKTLDFVGDSKNAPKIHNSGESTLRMGAILHLAQEYINVVTFMVIIQSPIYNRTQSEAHICIYVYMYLFIEVISDSSFHSDIHV